MTGSRFTKREWYESTANISDLSYYLVNVRDFSVKALLAFLEKTWKWENEFNEMREYNEKKYGDWK
tara:strand:- start:398 stop:595 length:198 start_codon:yes stop_codon:yes gene_type:complete